MEAQGVISFFPASEPTLPPSCYSISTLSCQTSYSSALKSQESHLFQHFPVAVVQSQTSICTQDTSLHHLIGCDYALVPHSLAGLHGLTMFSYLLWTYFSTQDSLNTCSLNKGKDEFSRAHVTKGGKCLCDRDEAIMYFGSRNIVINQSLCTDT